MFTLGDRIKQARLLAGKVSQAEFSEKIGVTQRSYSRYELGQTVPDAKILQNICNIAGVAIQWLLFGEGPMNKDSNVETYVVEHHVKPIEDMAPGESTGACKHCSDLSKKLDKENERLTVANERLYKAMEEVSDLKDQVSALKDQNAKLDKELERLKNAQPADNNEPPLASAH